jgi:TnsA endonuclease N terminal/TnsA endonuclease C terminal
MAKRKRATTKKQIEKRLKEGRGQGTFDQYIPWLKIQDVASLGLATRIKGCKTGRAHHFLSTLELDYFYLLEWSDEVIDIREQFPLDTEETLALADEISVKHPTDPTTKVEIVMTTDFLITVRQPIGKKEFARTIKYSKDVISNRTLEKFEIERLYWKERNVDWGIITELDINKTLISNIKWLHPSISKDSLPETITTQIIQKAGRFMLPLIKNKETSLRTITKCCDERLALETGLSLSIARHLIATKKWKTNMLSKIQPEKIFNLAVAKNSKEAL